MRYVAVLLCVVVICEASRKRYDGYQQWFVTPKTSKQLDVLRSMQDEVLFFDGEARRVNERVEMLISPAGRRTYGRRMQGMDLEIGNKNIQEYVDKEFVRLDEKHAPGFQVYDPDDYNTVEDIYSELERLASSECPSTHSCTVDSIGSSYEGRDIMRLSVTSSTSHHSIWLDSLIHAREWLAGTTVMRMADQLLTGTDEETLHLRDNYDFYIVPVMNPDGYDYSWTNDRFWRKSRNDISGTNCQGTDLNRNYNVFWDPNDHDGSSSSPCSDVYHGEAANDAPETTAVVNAAYDLNAEGRLLVWISYHTAAQFYLLPYGGTNTGECIEPADYDDMLEAAEAAVSAMEDVGGLRWTADNACDGLYPADGITMDFTHHSTDGANVKYSYTPELRGPGFDPSPGQIQPSFEENWAGLVALVDTIESIEGFATKK